MAVLSLGLHFFCKYKEVSSRGLNLSCFILSYDTPRTAGLFVLVYH